MNKIHAGDRRGITACGDNTSGRQQANVDLHPEQKDTVTCGECVKQVTDGWHMSDSTAKLIARKAR